MTDPVQPDDAFSVQPQIRRPWREFLDRLAPLRPDLHRYCCRLAGNVWDGEDLVQDVLLRAFGMLGKLDPSLENPRGYLIRTATHLWIDRMRRRERERALPIEDAAALPSPAQAAEVRDAMGTLIQQLAPRERAAVLMKDVFDLSLEETASVLQTSVGAVKAALHRGRGRLENADREQPAAGPVPSRELVERFVKAMSTKDLDGLRALCSADVRIELVGGVEFDSFERGKTFFEHAHFVMPQLGFGTNPRWESAVYEGEPVALGFRTLGGAEGLNEVHRLTAVDGAVVRIRCYCFCPDTLRTVGEHLGIHALRRAYRSPG
jgi:RNA polymerase sigma-70 factor (ECF subfamily)